jgi:predicted glycoside hydrolase/deacetylase ChbG (UPF0249 family)
MRRLIVNADDLGLTGGVNRAIAECHRRGIVSSATLMATGARFDEAAAMARELPGLSVGCHIVLVDGRPVLPPGQVRSLLAKGTDRFHYTIAEMLRAMAAGGFREKEVTAEAEAQISRLRAAGIAISHFDSHKHTHLFPRILRPLLRVAKANRIPAVRNPFDAPGVIPWRQALGRRMLFTRKAGIAVLTALLRQRWLREVRDSGLATTDGCLGVAATGSLTEAGVRAMLERTPKGCWELVCHPGYNDSELDTIRTFLRASREVEMAALAAITPEELRQRYGVELAGFREVG